MSATTTADAFEFDARRTAIGALANAGLLAANAYALGAGLHDDQFGLLTTVAAGLALLMFLIAAGRD